jgi:tRNA pseudouridine32 synthase/23S rRNA pseudouridine746 synthase
MCRTVEKRYVALLDGGPADDAGLVDLPLRVDLDDRPRQLVCHRHGKKALTRWRVVSREAGRTRIHFYPLTGRTHQLRLHAAHSEGLGAPIVGDVLYGRTKAQRMMLHAEKLRFVHPDSGKWLEFSVPPPF